MKFDLLYRIINKIEKHLFMWHRRFLKVFKMKKNWIIWRKLNKFFWIKITRQLYSILTIQINSTINRFLLLYLTKAIKHIPNPFSFINKKITNSPFRFYKKNLITAFHWKIKKRGIMNEMNLTFKKKPEEISGDRGLKNIAPRPCKLASA